MTDPISLLPPSSTTPLENAVSLTSAEARPVPYHGLRDLWDPWTCPEEFLPFLARALSVDIWRDEWPIERKRQVVADAKEHHRAKGSLWIIPEYLKLVDLSAYRIVAPPQTPFFGVPMTDEDYATWLSRLPQIRIYRNAPQTYRPLATASLAHWHTRRCFFGRSALVKTFPVEQTETRVTLWDRGTETELSHRDVVDRTKSGKAVAVREIVLPPKRTPSFMGRAAFGRSALIDDPVPARTIRLTSETDVERPEFFATRHAVSPKLDFVSLTPEYVSEIVPAAPGAAICGARRAFGRSFLLQSTAWKQVYERTYVNAPERWAGIDAGRPRAFFGHARFGMPAYHIDVTVDLSFTAPPRRMARFFGASFPPDTHHERLRDAKAALVAGKAERDTIRVTTQTRRRARVGDRIRVGTMRVGDTIPT